MVTRFGAPIRLPSDSTSKLSLPLAPHIKTSGDMALAPRQHRLFTDGSASYLAGGVLLGEVGMHIGLFWADIARAVLATITNLKTAQDQAQLSLQSP